MHGVTDLARYSMHGFCPLKSQLIFVPAYGLNFWSGLDDILVGIIGIKPTSSKDVHHRWFLGRWLVI